MRRAAWLLAGLLAASAPAAPAQEAPAALAASPASRLPEIPLTEAQEARAREIEGKLKCPVCRSQSIRSSNSVMAGDMQRKVREMVAAGSSEQEILDWFEARYGPYILLTPSTRGFNLVAWLLPFLVVLAGGVGVALAARRWKRRGPPSPPPPEPADSPYASRLDRELEETR